MAESIRMVIFKRKKRSHLGGGSRDQTVLATILVALTRTTQKKLRAGTFNALSKPSPSCISSPRYGSQTWVDPGEAAKTIFLERRKRGGRATNTACQIDAIGYCQTRHADEPSTAL